MKAPVAQDSRGNNANLGRQLLLWLALALHGLPGVLGQSANLPPLIPDRPGFYCGTQVVLPGVFQIETGIAFEQTTVGELESEAVVAPLVLRFGLLRDLELRLTTAGIPKSDQSVGNENFRDRGFASPAVGLKWHFAEGGDAAAEPSMAFLFSLNLPAGSRAFRPDRVEPAFNFASDFSLDDRTTLSTNLGVNLPFDPGQDEHYAELFLAAAVGRSLTPRSAWFLEVAGTAPGLDSADSTFLIDGGLTYLINNDLQLDVSLTRGLNRSTADWIVAGGISVRLH